MRLTIFGKSTIIVNKKSDHDCVQFKNGQIVVNSCKESISSLLRNFLADLLYSQLFKIYDRVKKEDRFELFGNLDFEVVNGIDGKKQRVAKLKGNKILVSLKAVAMPKSALKYMVVHELAHIHTKRHSTKFWKVVEIIYPGYNRGKQSLIRRKDFIQTPFIANETKR